MYIFYKLCRKVKDVEYQEEGKNVPQSGFRIDNKNMYYSKLNKKPKFGAMWQVLLEIIITAVVGKAWQN